MGGWRIFSNYSTNGGKDWRRDQPINSPNDGYSPQVAISGEKVVAVWKQHDGITNRIYSNYGSFLVGDEGIDHHHSWYECAIATAACSSPTELHEIIGTERMQNNTRINTNYRSFTPLDGEAYGPGFRQILLSL